MVRTSKCSSDLHFARVFTACRLVVSETRYVSRVEALRRLKKARRSRDFFLPGSGRKHENLVLHHYFVVD